MKLPKNDERFILWDNFFSKGKNYDVNVGMLTVINSNEYVAFEGCKKISHTF